MQRSVLASGKVILKKSDWLDVRTSLERYRSSHRKVELNFKKVFNFYKSYSDLLNHKTIEKMFMIWRTS